MKTILAFRVRAQSARSARLIWWQWILGIWLMGESGISGFLAPTVSRAWKEESGLASKLAFEDKDAVELQDVKHHSGNSSQNLSQLMRQELDAEVQEQQLTALIDVPIPSIVEEEGWSYKRRTVRHKAKSSEGKLINFMRKYAVGHDQVDCMILCRYGERVRHSWKHCLSQCVAKTDKRESFMRMLPDEDGSAKALDYDVPPEFEEDLERIRSEMKLQRRHGEL
mmetsp:Transcript_51383/g.81544  ORF Transcript_51383/g.81544 Transcript_51383/m.81544 type:complete len:224 (+) Transcript_51383:77-748(+)